MNISHCSPSYQVHCIATTASHGSSHSVDLNNGRECLIFTLKHIFSTPMFVYRGHTGEGAIITVPAGKVSALCAADCRFKSARYMSLFFAGNLSYFQCSHSFNALMIMNPLFGFRYLGCQGFLLLLFITTQVENTVILVVHLVTRCIA